MFRRLLFPPAWNPGRDFEPKKEIKCQNSRLKPRRKSSTIFGKESCTTAINIFLFNSTVWKDSVLIFEYSWSKDERKKSCQIGYAGRWFFKTFFWQKVDERACTVLRQLRTRRPSMEWLTAFSFRTLSRISNIRLIYFPFSSPEPPPPIKKKECLPPPLLTAVWAPQPWPPPWPQSGRPRLRPPGHPPRRRPPGRPRPPPGPSSRRPTSTPPPPAGSWGPLGGSQGGGRNRLDFFFKKKEFFRFSYVFFVETRVFLAVTFCFSH